MDALAHKALERGQATPACQSRARGFDSRSDEGVAEHAGAHRNLRRRHRLALSLHERGPEA
jgi:hypothetical protein